MASNHGYLGRAPGDSSVKVARQTYSVTGSTTDFTFSSGYDVGFIDVYLNGSKLITHSDYTASNGSTVTLSTAAEADDVVEIVAYKAFNIGTVDSANGNFTVGGNLTVDGTTTGTGNATYSGSLTVEGDINANGNIVGDNVTNITGINNINATAFFGDGSNLDGVVSGIELKDDGSSVGTAITTIDFSGFTVTPVSSGAHAGLSTVSLTQTFSVGTRSTSVAISLAGGSFTVTGRSANTIISV